MLDMLDSAATCFNNWVLLTREAPCTFGQEQQRRLEIPRTIDQKHCDIVCCYLSYVSQIQFHFNILSKWLLSLLSRRLT